MLNYLQNSLDHDEVSDTWFDEFSISKPNSVSTRNASRNTPRESKDIVPILRLTGRYLVRPTVDPKSESRDVLEENLNKLNSEKQTALTNYLADLPMIKEVGNRTFQIKEKGDLFNRYFTYFEFEIILR